MRSLLFVPGDSETKLAKGHESGADILLVDLEDSVSAGQKPEARRIAAEFISARRGSGPKLFVRVNDLETGLTDDDLAVVMAARPDGIMLPKSNCGQDVTRLSAKLNAHEARNDIAEGATQIVAIISETAAGVLSAGTYGGASTRLIGVTWGAEDLSADVGARTARGDDGTYTDAFRLARALTLLGASSAGVAAVDTVFVNYRDESGLAAECLAAERDGFTAKMAIHPAQVPIINAAFTPSPEAVEEAQRVVAAFAEAPGAGVLGIGGKMYDRPHLRRAERLLARAAAAGGV